MRKLILVIFFSLCVSIYGYGQICKIKNDSLCVSFSNPLLVPIEFRISVNPSAINKVKTKNYFIIPSKDTICDVVKIPLSIIQDTSEINLAQFLDMNCSMGNSRTFSPNKDYPYELPFPKGKKYKVIQSYNGKFSHRKYRSSNYAIDFNLGIGDTITAARSGLVVSIKEDFNENGGVEYMNKANELFIAHDDGTFGYYVHMKYKGVLVEVGDSIETGHPIGLSGNTGYSTGPHLHFAILTPMNTSIPIRFVGYRNKEQLEEGEYYVRIE